MLHADIAEAVATVTLNRPDRLNALDLPIMDRLRESVESLGQHPDVQAIVLSGADLRALDTDAEDPRTVARHLSAGVTPLCEAMLACPVPIVVAVNGPCVGAAVGLALLADITIAARSAYFQTTQVTALRLVPDVGLTWVLAKHIGRARALGLTLTGERITAAQAAEWGLIWRVVDDDALTSHARMIAQQLATTAVPAAATRSLIDASSTTTLAAALDEETRAQEARFHDPRVYAAIAGFARRATDQADSETS